MSLRKYRIAVRRLKQADNEAVATIEAVFRGGATFNEGLAVIRQAKALCRQAERAARRIRSIGGDGAMARAYLAAS